MFPDSAVDLFFCLSGFSLCLAYKAGSGGGLDFWPYIRARFARIYPLYAVSLGLMWWLVFRHLGGSGYYPTPLYFADAVRQVFMVNTWPLIGSGSNWDFPAWSLSVEAFCYIGIFPLLFKSLPRLMAWSVSRRLCLLVVLGFVSVIAFVRLWDGFMVSVHLYHPHPISLWIPMLRGVTLFTAGGIIYSFWVRKDAVASLAGQACDAVALAGFGILVGAFFMTLHKDYLTLLAPALVLGLAVNEKAVVARLLAAQPFYWLGEISYSLYLLHVPIDYELHHAWPALSHWPLPDFFISMAAMLAASTLSYYGFESPLRSWIKGRKRVLQAVPTAP